VAVTAAVTLATAGLLTWVGVDTFAAPSALRPEPGLPPDPCSEVREETLEGVGGEFSGWSTGVYSNGCSWVTSLIGEEPVYLHFNRAVPLSEADARVAEQFGDVSARDADELYREHVDQAGELGYESEEAAVLDTEEKDLDLGDESVIVVTTIGFGTGQDFRQNVNIVVREGGLVSRINAELPGGSYEVDADEAEELLSDVATDIFG
jgi:hypothetical protein